MNEFSNGRRIMDILFPLSNLFLVCWNNNIIIIINISDLFAWLTMTILFSIHSEERVTIYTLIQFRYR